ncbi:MAG: ArsR family transcriptional regulator [Promethearchaeota archaeon]|nr:MAG: ArsR family transcriptional regulator [Candidatus Lokiarchaeota archaeon]
MTEITDKIVDFLKVVADQTRLDILILLKNGPKTSKQIQKALNKKQSTISQHLKTLADAELITIIKKEDEIVNHYTIKYQYIFKILSFIQSFIITIEKDKRRELSNLDVYDTLF